MLLLLLPFFLYYGSKNTEKFNSEAYFCEFFYDCPQITPE
jgi:hypothetical protein